MQETKDKRPPWWPRAPRWPFDASALASLTAGAGLPPPQFLMQFAGQQRQIDARRWHLIHLIELEGGKDSKKTVREWYLGCAKSAGWECEISKFPGGIGKEVTGGEFMSGLWTACAPRLSREPYSPPPDIPRTCDKCEKKCTGECGVCGEPFCSRKCLVSHWNLHRRECAVVYENSSLAPTLTLMEMKKSLSPQELSVSMGYVQEKEGGGEGGSAASAAKGVTGFSDRTRVTEEDVATKMMLETMLEDPDCSDAERQFARTCLEQGPPYSMFNSSGGLSVPLISLAPVSDPRLLEMMADMQGPAEVLGREFQLQAARLAVSSNPPDDDGALELFARGYVCASGRGLAFMQMPGQPPCLFPPVGVLGVPPTEGNAPDAMDRSSKACERVTKLATQIAQGRCDGPRAPAHVWLSTLAGFTEGPGSPACRKALERALRAGARGRFRVGILTNLAAVTVPVDASQSVRLLREALSLAESLAKEEGEGGGREREELPVVVRQCIEERGLGETERMELRESPVWLLRDLGLCLDTLSMNTWAPLRASETREESVRLLSTYMESIAEICRNRRVSKAEYRHSALAGFRLVVSLVGAAMQVPSNQKKAVKAYRQANEFLRRMGEDHPERDEVLRTRLIAQTAFLGLQQQQGGGEAGAHRTGGALIVVCNQCKKAAPQGQSFQRCGRCQKVAYCGKECQKMDWKQHKKACKDGSGGKSKE
uniref:MYND-type domain-containing protein n=1 Tax=Chromera velia CCMP2878 TaxID=1169474 RepID=A0A0G4GGH2_9ALVE|eukprot:Cvel_21803.t1-p1 / transcript=Cvel_21803.t1 / gene=Cvel_21803 / organism=Chromera_velia_CCMP2878 / gene_product=hypothetical protein / transcript_product=hypothetical protein / location=Cvel_scaffold2077:28914-31043(+) / protein_length=710 / sequence_SO=supercontig / SO=protein_coding / is_pseudo=false